MHRPATNVALSLKCIIFIVYIVDVAWGFVLLAPSLEHRTFEFLSSASALMSQADPDGTVSSVAVDERADVLNSDVAGQFKVLTCSSTSCSKKRKRLNLDQYSTFSAFYARASETSVRVEESPCLGRCKQAPCVAIEHDDYDGTVSLEGMTPVEFSDRVFQNIIDENDVERVWSSVVNAVEVMSEEIDEDEVEGV